MPNFRQRKWLLIAIAIAVVLILTLIAAPNSGGRKNDSGSTYGRNPDGYGAWYEYMSQRDIPIERWRKPFAELIEEDIQGVTYLKILSKTDFLLGARSLSQSESNWVRQGNTLVIIGNYQPATAAPFRSKISYRPQPLSETKVEIATTRRYQPLAKQNQNSSSQDQADSKSKNQTKIILADQYGAVVWQEQMGKGKIIYCTTPYLAANAYQDAPDNFKFLAELVSDRQKIWVDEYIHGYKDKETIAREQQQDVFSYLAKTPLLLLFIQTVLVGIIAAITALRRFGQPVVPKTAIADNSTAYIDALAGVLEKANSTDFVVEAIIKDEQRKLQTALGLGKSLVDRETLITAWNNQKQESATELSQLLQFGKANQKISDAQLITWIQKWQKINQDH
ncbi:MAG: DUF4350 domain-containing protein [Cyanobacteria bacterium P01_A01_bin.40]